MRILYLCADPGVPVFGRKGCSTHVRETCLALTDAGHEVVLAATNLEGDGPGRDRFRSVEAPPYESRRLGFDLRRLLSDRRLERVARELAGSWRPEAIYERYSILGDAGGRLARRFRLPHILEVNAFMTREMSDRLRFGRPATLLERRTFRRAGHVVTVSDPLLREIGELRGGTDGITLMPMAVNLALFHPGDGSAVRARLGLEGRFVVGYVGALTAWHGIELLYELAERLRAEGIEKAAILVVGGDDRRLEANRARVRERGLEGRLIFAGQIPYGDVPEHVRAFDAALVPDTTEWSSPAKLFEYQGCGVPVVAPDYPAIRRAMDDGVEGCIFPPRDVAAMAGRLAGLARDPEGARAMGARGRDRAARFHSWEAHAHEIARLFEREREAMGPAR